MSNDPSLMDVVLRNVRRIATVDRDSLDTALLPQMIGGETSSNNIGWKRPDNITHYYQPRGGNNTNYGTLGIGTTDLAGYPLAVNGDIGAIGAFDAGFNDGGGHTHFSASGAECFRDNMYITNSAETVGAINYITDRAHFFHAGSNVMVSIKDGTVAINTEDEIEGYELIVDGTVGARGGYNAVWDVAADVVQFNGSGVNTDRPNIYYAQGGGTDRLMEFITTGRQEWWTNNIKRMELTNDGELHLNKRDGADYSIVRLDAEADQFKYLIAYTAESAVSPNTILLRNSSSGGATALSAEDNTITVTSGGVTIDADVVVAKVGYTPTVATSIVTKDYVDDLPFVESALVPDPAVTSHDLKSYAEGNNILLGGQVYFNTGIAHDTIIGTLGGNSGGRKVIPAIARNYTAPTTTIPVLVVWQSSGVMNLWMGDDEASTGECRIFFDGITVRASQNTPFDEEPETLED